MADQQPKSSGKPSLPKPGGSGMYWIYIVMFAVLLSFFFLRGDNTGQKTTFSPFSEMLRSGDVNKLQIINEEVAEVYIKADSLKKDRYKMLPKSAFGNSVGSGPHFFFRVGSLDKFIEKLDAIQAEMPEEQRIEVEYSTRTDWFGESLSWLLPIGLLIVFWIFIMRRMSAGAGGAGSGIFNFGKSNARIFEGNNKSSVTFENVAGHEEAKAEVREIVDFLKSPEKYTRLGAKIPKGVILAGPPGTGKTLLAKAVAGEAGVPFFSLSGSEFVEMFVGVGASRVRDLFKKAKEKAPCIIFIDEIDAIGRSRGKQAAFSGNDERENTLNQLLAEMDGFGSNTGVIVLAATNRANILDRALLRPGRFDRHIYLDLPNLNERKGIFKVHMKNLKVATEISGDQLARQTPGFSGADIANVCNEAALVAARKDKEAIDLNDFMDAIDRVVAGLERKSKVISKTERKTIAWHEAGHALASWLLPHANALVKVTIIPRGRSLGAAWYMPEERQLTTTSQFMDEICTMLAGRASEELVFNEISSGALDDLERATKQAYNMVAFYGLDEELGNISYYDSSGQDSQFQKPYSEETGQLIDKRVRELLEGAFARVTEILTNYRPQLDAIAELLLQKEIILKEDIEEIMGFPPASAALTTSDTIEAPSAALPTADQQEKTANITNTESTEDAPSETQSDEPEKPSEPAP